jgi:hypothetical protein
LFQKANKQEKGIQKIISHTIVAQLLELSHENVSDFSVSTGV